MHPDFTAIDPCPLLAPVPVVLVSSQGMEGNPNLITLDRKSTRLNSSHRT